MLDLYLLKLPFIFILCTVDMGTPKLSANMWRLLNNVWHCNARCYICDGLQCLHQIFKWDSEGNLKHFSFLFNRAMQDFQLGNFLTHWKHCFLTNKCWAVEPVGAKANELNISTSTQPDGSTKEFHVFAKRLWLKGLKGFIIGEFYLAKQPFFEWL